LQKEYFSQSREFLCIFYRQALTFLVELEPELREAASLNAHIIRIVLLLPVIPEEHLQLQLSRLVLLLHIPIQIIRTNRKRRLEHSRVLVIVDLLAVPKVRRPFVPGALPQELLVVVVRPQTQLETGLVIDADEKARRGAVQHQPRERVVHEHDVLRVDHAQIEVRRLVKSQVVEDVALKAERVQQLLQVDLHARLVGQVNVGEAVGA